MKFAEFFPAWASVFHWKIEESNSRSIVEIAADSWLSFFRQNQIPTVSELRNPLTSKLKLHNETIKVHFYLFIHFFWKIKVVRKIFKIKALENSQKKQFMYFFPNIFRLCQDFYRKLPKLVKIRHASVVYLLNFGTRFSTSFKYRMELKSVHWRFCGNRITSLTLNLQSHWLIFVNFGNLCRFFEVWPLLKELLRENM